MYKNAFHHYHYTMQIAQLNCISLHLNEILSIPIPLPLDSPSNTKKSPTITIVQVNRKISVNHKNITRSFDKIHVMKYKNNKENDKYTQNNEGPIILFKQTT